jgi:hypothetical protein
MMELTNEKKREIYDEFCEAVNMAPKELEEWLGTEESRSVGDDPDGESTGHKSGRRIVEIKRKKKAELSDADYEHMNKVNGYVHRHMKQGPSKSDAEDSKWRYSLMNWGHDPLKD